jgi:carbon starvation protein
MHAMPIMLAVLCAMAIAYRYYSAFLAARVATLDDLRTTPAVRFDDGQNYEPTNKWVLFGHHFAAISGAGPLIGPVLAAQFGYLPGLLWIVIGVCLAGAVQDFLVLAASIRRDGKSLAQIAFHDIGKVAGTAAMIAILFILVIALAGLGKVVVKALGGESVPFPVGSEIVVSDQVFPPVQDGDSTKKEMIVQPGHVLRWNGGKSSMPITEKYAIISHGWFDFSKSPRYSMDGKYPFSIPLPSDAVRLIPGSPWGTFTIAATIPIALFIGLYMNKLRKGRVLEASIVGGILTLAATFAGGWIAHHQIASYFNLSQTGVLWAMAIYGFIAAVLPVWVLLVPRDYLSSFLKIGTIALLVIGVIIANPKMNAPAINDVFSGGGPAVPGKIFPFLFITIMCGAISGFHSLVSSGTTPKMIKRETDARMIGYGAMLVEGLVGVVAMIAAATLPVGDYYAMNTDLAVAPKFHDRILLIPGGEIEHVGDYERLTEESLRGRTGGAVTLAVGMAQVFDNSLRKFGIGVDWLWKYWYHFAIMFEALFILTTIDAGTRIGRFLLQEMLGKAIHPKLADTRWWPAAIFSTAVIVGGWAYFINSGDFAAIWAMFGVANQMLAVIALAVVSVYLFNEGKGKYVWVTVGPMIVVMTTTSTAAIQILLGKITGIQTQLAKGFSQLTSAEWALLRSSAITAALLVAMLACTMIIIAAAGVKIATARVVKDPQFATA